MKVALVSAPYDTALFRVGENLGTKYLAATLAAHGVCVDVIDPSLELLDTSTLVKRLTSLSYDMVGFSVMFDSALTETVNIVEELRRAGCESHITLGGHMPTFNYAEILNESPGVDSIVRFEGEETIVELLDAVAGQKRLEDIKGLAFRKSTRVHVNQTRDLIDDLDRLPFPLRDGTSRHLGDPHFFVTTTRGCPFTCTFCSIPTFYKEPKGLAWRARSVENVLLELQYLKTSWGAKSISFLDDEFLVGRNGKRRARELATGMTDRSLDLTWSFECRADDVEESLFRDLKIAGLRNVFVGVESGSQSTLDLLDKRTTVEQNRNAIRTIRGLGLSLGTGFIMYNPYTRADEIAEQIDFLEEMEIGSYKAFSSKTIAYRGTRLAKQIEADGRLVKRHLTLDYTFVDPKAALLQEIFVEHLRPLHEIDLARRRIEFSLDNLSKPSQAAIEAVAHLATTANASLAGLARLTLSYVRGARHHPVDTGSAFLRELSEAVQEELTRLRAHCEAVRQLLEQNRQCVKPDSG